MGLLLRTTNLHSLQALITKKSSTLRVVGGISGTSESAVDVDGWLPAVDVDGWLPAVDVDGWLPAADVESSLGTSAKGPAFPKSTRPEKYHLF